MKHSLSINCIGGSLLRRVERLRMSQVMQLLILRLLIGWVNLILGNGFDLILMRLLSLQIDHLSILGLLTRYERNKQATHLLTGDGDFDLLSLKRRFEDRGPGCMLDSLMTVLNLFEILVPSAVSVRSIILTTHLDLLES
jgi:hypothetical protein